MGKTKYKTDEERLRARRDSAKRWYDSHKMEDISPEEQLRRRLSRRRAYIKQVKRNQEIIDRYKNVPCADCNNRFPSECMDFDHVRGEKKFQIGTEGKKLAVTKTDVLLDEIAKCEVVCANCHRIRTRRRILEERRQLDIASGLIQAVVL